MDVAISRAFTYENLELIKTILECGAKTEHRLNYSDSNIQDPNVYEILGPNLLHAVLARKLDNDSDEQVQMLLSHFRKYLILEFIIVH